MSHWQKVKLSHKEGKRKQEIEKHFGIKNIEIMAEQVRKEIKKDPEMFEKLKENKKKKSK